MKKVAVGILLAIGCTGGLLAITAARRAPTIRPNVTVSGVPVGGMTVEDAQRALRVWWETEKLKPLKLHSALPNLALPDMKPGDLGITLDDVASVAKLPLQDAFTDIKAAATQETFSEAKFDAIYKPNGIKPLELTKLVQKSMGAPKPARVVMVKGVIERTPEVTTAALDVNGLLDAVSKALKSGGPVELPVVEAPKKFPDDQLAQITDVVSEFKTHFPRRQYNRNENLRLASGRLNGVILMPGQQMSFNKTVGQRTEKQGFKLAGVYKNGKHDTGIGGGICQVSTTLYNASLYGNLKIVRRSNHSMPVAYVPLGRDATVDWGSLDLVIENNYSTPIAISSEFQPGTLTFRILGKKVPGQWVKILQVGGKSWSNGVQVTHDSKLPPGAKVVVDKGSAGHSIRTYRLVYQNDTLVSKQPLGFSYYGGGDKIIAVGPTAAPTPVVGTAPVTATKASGTYRTTGG